MANRRHEKPFKRVNPSGKVRWVARITLQSGRRKQTTHSTKGEAQAAIDEAYDREYSSGRAPRQVGTVAVYVEHWERLHPRSPRTASKYARDLRAALAIRVGGRELRSWRMDEVERSEISEVVDYLLRVDGRAAQGVRNVLRTLSAMWEDAISDGWTKHNPVSGVRVRGTDPRVQRQPRKVNVYSWEQMHEFAGNAPTQQGMVMIRCLSDLGLRLGEMIPLQRGDIDDGWVWVRRTAHDGSVEAGTKTTREAPENARKVPLPLGLAMALTLPPRRIDSLYLFPSLKGGIVNTSRFYVEVWAPSRAATPSMGDARPHDFRHSYVSLMRAAGVDPAHLARWTGHTVLTATSIYTHPVGDVSDQARRMVG